MRPGDTVRYLGRVGDIAGAVGVVIEDVKHHDATLFVRVDFGTLGTWTVADWMLAPALTLIQGGA